MDRSAEQAFFAERETALSDHPVSWDAEPQAERPDLEQRERRREVYSRIVSGIVGVLAVGVVWTFARPTSHVVDAVEAAPLIAHAARPPVEQPAVLPFAEPAPLIPTLASSAGVVPIEPKLASALPAPPHGSGRPRVLSVPRVLSARVKPPLDPAPSAPPPIAHDSPPPTARFAD